MEALKHKVDVVIVFPLMALASSSLSIHLGKGELVVVLSFS